MGIKNKVQGGSSSIKMKISNMKKDASYAKIMSGENEETERRYDRYVDYG